MYKFVKHLNWLLIFINKWFTRYVLWLAEILGIGYDSSDISVLLLPYVSSLLLGLSAFWLEIYIGGLSEIAISISAVLSLVYFTLILSILMVERNQN